VRRTAPPLQGIEAFVVAAGAPSFRVAADRLALSPSAFTRRIQSLEGFVGARLFDRAAGTSSLTEAGQAYREEVEPAIEAIRAATARLRSPPTRSVRVMASQSFAISWLLPRSPEYQAQSGQAIDLVLSRDLSLLRLGRADVAVANGPADFGGLSYERLLELDGAPVSAPALADGRGPPRTLEELRGHTLLSVQTPQDLWPSWLARAGAAEPVGGPGMVFETLTLMYEAAANGLGIAVAVPTVADRYLEAGRLRPCFPLQAATGADYNLVYASEAVRRRPPVRAFATWMKRQAEGSGARFGQLLQQAGAA